MPADRGRAADSAASLGFASSHADLDAAGRHLGVFLLVDGVKLGGADVGVAGKLADLMHRCAIVDGSSIAVLRRDWPPMLWPPCHQARGGPLKQILPLPTEWPQAQDVSPIRAVNGCRRPERGACAGEWGRRCHHPAEGRIRGWTIGGECRVPACREGARSAPSPWSSSRPFPRVAQPTRASRHRPSRKIGIGRPLLERTSCRGLKPSRWKRVAARSSGEPASRVGAVPRSSVDP